MSTLPIVPPRLPSFRRARVAALGALFALVPLVMVLSVAQHASSAASSCAWAAQPQLAYGPGDVVELQVDALQANDALGDDRGILVAWRLASAQNRAYTGPFPRFAMMVKSPTYAPLLAHDGARFGAVSIEGDVAQQRVVVDKGGVWLAYRWTLSRDPSGAWRTDSVLPEPLE